MGGIAPDANAGSGAADAGAKFLPVLSSRAAANAMDDPQASSFVHVSDLGHPSLVVRDQYISERLVVEFDHQQ